MKFITYALLFSSILMSQGPASFTIFHRLLILNDQDEIMLVKFKDKDIWVTPGIYQDKKQSVKDAFQDLMNSYGIQTTAPKFHASFDLHFKDSDNVAIRTIYTVKMKSGKIKMPDIIDEIQWLPLEKAIQKMTFPHISLMMEQVLKYKNSIWSGSVIRFKEGDVNKAEVFEAFYKIR